MSIGVAIIGSGVFAKTEHLPAVQAIPSHLTLRAVYSRSLKSASALLATPDPSVTIYSDDAGTGKTYDDLLARSDIHAVIIALPILTQPDFIKKALTAGKHVLAEKPIAKDVATAKELLQFYRECKSGATFAIAENFRWVESFRYAREKVAEMGRVLGFKGRMQTMVKHGGKYFETAWRKTPEYQGGFLLDGGVHFVAALRLMLGEENQPVRLSAFSSQLQEHLPPVDSLDAVWLTKNGVHGQFNVAFGTTFTGSDYAIATEKGVVHVERGVVRITNPQGKTEEEKQLEWKFPDEGNGVKNEVKAWAESIQNGKPEALLAPEEGLRDLQILEAMLRSGESRGTPTDLDLIPLS